MLLTNPAKKKNNNRQNTINASKEAKNALKNPFIYFLNLFFQKYTFLLLLHEYFMAIAYLLLGTNIGCRSDNLKNTRSHINQLAGKICISSSVYETAAWGKVEQDDYLNQVLKIN